MKEKREIVYLKADRNSVCHDPKIKIQDVMSVQCADPAICAGIKNKTLYTFKKNDGQKKEGKKKKRMEVFSMLNVIERIQTDYPDVEIVSIGEQDFVVQLLDAPMAPKWLETLKVVVMVVVIFLGAAFTIMAFNNDVSVGEVFDRFYQQVMGKEKPKVSEIEIFYCLGLAVGILVFFNHIGKKKITSDPTACGIAVSAGTFAFLLVIGVIPRMIKRCNFGERILMVENTVILGVLTGAVFSVVEWKAQLPYPWLAHVILGAYGTAAGIFVGCIAVALAEILNTFPILFRRLYINRGLSGVMIAMALGKMAGSFYYFFFGYGLPKYW